MVGALGLLKSVRDQAWQSFRTALNDDILQGRSVEAIPSGYLYGVCRLDEHPRTFGDIAAISKISAKRVKCGDTVLTCETRSVGAVGPEQHVPKLCRQSTSAGILTHAIENDVDVILIDTHG